jgi:dipeptidyl aminopeptidase/acylaminoacyl peptidase
MIALPRHAVRTLVAVSLAFSPLGAARGQQPTPAVPEKSAPTHEALWALKRVGAPAVSADGKWIAVAVTEPAYDETKEVVDLWLVAGDGNIAPRRLTSAKGSESGAAWSPDGRRLAFSAKREDDTVAQIYVLDVAGGGEAQRVTTAALAARAPRWSPDGRELLYQSSAYPGAANDEANKKIAGERKDLKFKVRAFDGFPIRRWDKWLDDTQTHLFVVSADPLIDRPGSPAFAPSRDLLAGTKLVAQPGYGGPGGEGATEDLAAAWSPDGTSIVFAATTGRNAAAYSPVNTHLWSVPTAGGEPTALTTGDASFSSPQFSPDGRRLCFKVGEEWSKIYALDRLACGAWPWTAGAFQKITAAFDRSIGDFSIAADGRIFFTAEDQGFVKLFVTSAQGGEAKPVAPVAPVVDVRGAFGGFEVPDQLKAPAVVASWGSATEPAEIVRVDPATRKVKVLTHFASDAAAKLDWAPLEEFWFTNAAGKKVHSFVVKPSGFDPAKKYPLFVLIHGGHANMWRDQISLRWNYHLLARPGYVLLLTDYRGSTGYGEAFTLDIVGDPLRGPGDDLNRAADEAIARYPWIDATRQAAGGASYGGHLANWLEASTTRYKCLISHAGLSSLQTQWSTSDGIHGRELMMGGPWWENPTKWLDQSPVAYAKDFKTPMLLSVGENDFRVPMNNTLEMYAVLQRQRVPARLLVWPDENHWILKGENGRVFYREVADWLARWLGPTATTPATTPAPGY